MPFAVPPPGELRHCPWSPAVAFEVYTAAVGNRGARGGGCSHGPTEGSEVDAFGLKEEQVGKGLTAGTLTLLFFNDPPPTIHAHTVLEKARCHCLKSIYMD